MSALLGNFLVVERVEPGISLDDDTILRRFRLGAYAARFPHV
jgi:hypothetical protein